MMSALAFYATASVSFSAGLVFGAYWATRDKGAAEPAHVSRLEAHLQWLKDTADDRSKAHPIRRDVVRYRTTPEVSYRFSEGQL